MNNIGWKWNEVNNPLWDNAEMEVKLFAQLCKDKGFRTFLDIGAGRGRHTYMFSKFGFDVLAIDISESSIESINRVIDESHSVGIRTLLWDMHDIDKLDSHFDAILAWNSIYHTNENGLNTIIDGIYSRLNASGIALATFLSIKDHSFNGSRVSYKTEEDGSVVEHIYLDEYHLKEKLKRFNILSFVEKTYSCFGETSVHYYVTIQKPYHITP